MVELIGDICEPSTFSLPQKTSTEADVLSGANILSGALIYNTTLGKVEVFIGGGVWETITSVAR